VNNGLRVGALRPDSTNALPSPLGPSGLGRRLVADVLEAPSFSIHQSGIPSAYSPAHVGEWRPPRGVSRVWVSGCGGGGLSCWDVGTSATSLGGGAGAFVRVPVLWAPDMVASFVVGFPRFIDQTNATIQRQTHVLIYRRGPDGLARFGSNRSSLAGSNGLYMTAFGGATVANASGSTGVGGAGGNAAVYIDNVQQALATGGAGAQQTGAIPAGNGTFTALPQAQFPGQIFGSGVFGGPGGGQRGVANLASGAVAAGAVGSQAFAAGAPYFTPVDVAPSALSLRFDAGIATVDYGHVPVPGVWGCGARPRTSGGSGPVPPAFADYPGSCVLIFEWEDI